MINGRQNRIDGGLGTVRHIRHNIGDFLGRLAFLWLKVGRKMGRGQPDSDFLE